MWWKISKGASTAKHVIVLHSSHTPLSPFAFSKFSSLTDYWPSGVKWWCFVGPVVSHVTQIAPPNFEFSIAWAIHDVLNASGSTKASQILIWLLCVVSTSMCMLISMSCEGNRGYSDVLSYVIHRTSFPEVVLWSAGYYCRGVPNYIICCYGPQMPIAQRRCV